jgi:hypothetical protein
VSVHISTNNKTDCHDIAAILLKVALNTIKPTQFLSYKEVGEGGVKVTIMEM